MTGWPTAAAVRLDPRWREVLSRWLPAAFKVLAAATCRPALLQLGRVNRTRNIAISTVLFSLTLAGCGSSPPGRLAGVGAFPAPPSAWPAALHDARHSATATVVGPQIGHIRWARHLEGDVTPGPVIGVDGSVIAASNAGV